MDYKEIEDKDLIVGEVYAGLYKNKEHYYFRYLGNGKWTSGRGQINTGSILKDTHAYSANTNNVKAYCHIPVSLIGAAPYLECNGTIGKKTILGKTYSFWDDPPEPSKPKKPVRILNDF